MMPSHQYQYFQRHDHGRQFRDHRLRRARRIQYLHRRHASGQALDFAAITSSTAVINITNHTGALIGASGDDAIRPGAGTISITNDGLIDATASASRATNLNTSSLANLTSFTLTNQAHGVIQSQGDAVRVTATTLALTRPHKSSCASCRRGIALGGRFGIGAVMRVPVGAAAEHTVIAGFHPAAVGRKTGQTQFQQLPHGRRACRHPVLEAKSVECRQLFGREHDLQPFTANVAHRKHPKLDH